MRNLDIELTNRCNAQCTFCPRDQTPDQGFMSFDIFKRSVQRARELELTPKIHSAGQGEPTLHPQLPEFAQYVHEQGIEYGFTTNGSLLTEELARKVIDANVSHIVFSISDLDEDYEEVYALKFDVTRSNIMRFLDINEELGKPIRTTVSLVAHDLNKPKLSQYRKFWAEAGIDEFIHYDQTNRGGACEIGRYFVDNDGYKAEAADFMGRHKLSHVCGVPFVMLFIGWNGQYYLCCNDYRKLTPLGSVLDHSIEEMDLIKKARFFEDEAPEACKNCDLDVTNRVREVMFEIEAGEASNKDLDILVTDLQKQQSTLEEFYALSD
tara:strand:+ start:286 stop:1254 length:969 start_codon:yes stop_codon:yes gene_type:complete